MNDPLVSVLRKLVTETGVGLNHGGYLVVTDPDPDPMGTGTICISLTPDEFNAMWTLLDEQPCTYSKCPHCHG